MNSTKPFLSIVIPAYNEERRLPQTLPTVAEFFAVQDYQTEILVVDDGSTDNTVQVVKQITEQHDAIRVVEAEHRGKGHAVKVGMLAAQGQYAFLADADWAMPVTELPKFLPPQRVKFQLAIGSREGHGAVRYDEPIYRHFMGRVFNGLVQLLAVSGFEDTQCGFKCFHRSVIPDLFEHQTTDGFGFDVELLYIAQKRGYKIDQVPIHWHAQDESKVNPVKDTLRMLQDIIQVRLNDRKGVYERHQNLLDSAGVDPEQGFEPLS
ncbi:glycosyltransferase family 2 protein [Anaerolineales bacterium HSG6]|nr:glycosyltransferase family 2 protein [Anaerolineales bacterium HSG6]